MDQYTIFGISGNPSTDIAKAWLKNHGIPFDSRSVRGISRQEIEKLAALVPGGARALVFPDVLSCKLTYPHERSIASRMEMIQDPSLTEDEIITVLAETPYLLMIPIIFNGEKILIGYDYDTMVSTYKNVRIKDVKMA